MDLQLLGGLSFVQEVSDSQEVSILRDPSSHEQSLRNVSSKSLILINGDGESGSLRRSLICNRDPKFEEKDEESVSLSSDSKDKNEDSDDDGSSSKSSEKKKDTADKRSEEEEEEKEVPISRKGSNFIEQEYCSLIP